MRWAVRTKQLGYKFNEGKLHKSIVKAFLPQDNASRKLKQRRSAVQRLCFKNFYSWGGIVNEHNGSHRHTVGIFIQDHKSTKAHCFFILFYGIIRKKAIGAKALHGMWNRIPCLSQKEQTSEKIQDTKTMQMLGGKPS